MWRDITRGKKSTDDKELKKIKNIVRIKISLTISSEKFSLVDF